MRMTGKCGAPFSRQTLLRFLEAKLRPIPGNGVRLIGEATRGGLTRLCRTKRAENRRGFSLYVSAKQGATDSSKGMQGDLGAGDDAYAQPMAPERSYRTLLLAVLEERLLSCVNLTAGMIPSHPRHVRRYRGIFL